MHKHHEQTQPPQTQGNLIRWATYYDPVVKLLTLGQAAALRQQTATLAQIQAGHAVLDVGCGTGDLTLVAKQRAGIGGEVAGIDASPEMINEAHKKATAQGATINFQVGLIEQIPFPDNSFDVVTSSLMMHHLPEGLKSQGLAEIYRVLRPNGHLLIVDFKVPESFFSKATLILLFHGRLHTGVTELRSKVEKTGFHNISTGTLNLRTIGYLSAHANKGV